MTATTDPRLAPSPGATPSSPLKRVTAIALAEVKLLLRNRVVLATAVLLGPAMAGFFVFLNREFAESAIFMTYVVNLVFVFGALLALFYNLTTIFVTRREERVFKRLATGEATYGEALAATSAPSVVIFVGQVVLAGVAAAFFAPMPSWDNPLLVVLAMVLVIVCFVSLAAWHTSFTSTSEGAQYTTLPAFIGFMLFSGIGFPTSMMPDVMGRIAEFTPLHAASELILLGMSGENQMAEVHSGFADSMAAGLFPLAVLAGWTVAGVVLARMFMRFEPRR
ncbi:MAG: ABC transporter permease [bacterium]|nr:ABC transporter permease [bacterium]